MEKVFVYGTLKEGHGNNVLLSFSERLGTGITEDKYIMYELGIPYVSKSFKLTRISGEVYRVKLDTLEALDLLEGHPNWYKREKVEVEYYDLKSNSHIKDYAWLYFNEQIPNSAEVNKHGIYGHEKASKDLKSLL